MLRFNYPLASSSSISRAKMLLMANLSAPPPVTSVTDSEPEPEDVLAGTASASTGSAPFKKPAGLQTK